MERYGAANQAADDNIIWRMRFICWITKATDTLRIGNLIYFPRQQWLGESALVLRYSYIVFFCTTVSVTFMKLGRLIKIFNKTIILYKSQIKPLHTLNF